MQGDAAWRYCEQAVSAATIAWVRFRLMAKTSTEVGGKHAGGECQVAPDTVDTFCH
jgi:hypothetical protein